MNKIMTIVGTRPELIKLSLVIKELDKHTNHILVHTGQNYDYELNQIFFKDLEIRKPNYYLNVAEENLAKTIAKIIEKSDEVMEIEKPEAILIYGDTNSCLSVIPAKRRKIPIFHMEAGNRCFDQRVPEELNRKIIDHLSDINMVLTEHARRYLIREGINPETIIKVGSSLVEIFEHFKSKIQNSNILNELGLKEKDYIVISLHREENVDNPRNFDNFLKSLSNIQKYYDKKIIISTHPRTRKKIEQNATFFKDDNISFLKPFGFFDYVKLETNSFCVLSDSGTITEEASILKFPAVTLRQAHERPEGMDEGTLIMTEINSDSIINAINIVTNQAKEGFELKTVSDYESKNVSQKVIRIIVSYIEYVNRTVWFKHT
ncbi:UDP-N-acetylglucosamine 2-epimerase [Petrotoga mobilis SJ95]|uniref:UDP-N-acetylglucosamine 2-epimerase n=1 Tax=Petrotoga mobilis (strain DSM 10674 / SJ95) TaxID=403833 RepID=A9BGE7_PETMO|nr:UDP-N-acetylglucosamine 2-epimerase (non-hydrolyzing) [Petrotoga mobilis]ABX31997.1 UDP-N-acetylglucosamine 2-epimerase [Petrotoga mobilis SJ95]